MEELTLFHKLSINSKDVANIDATLIKQLKHDVERKCSPDGYIVEITEIINRTKGKIDINDLTGSILYDISYKANVYNVSPGDIIVGAKVTVVAPQVGIFLEKNEYLKPIFISASNLTKEYEINDILHVVVLDAECGTGKPNITIVAKPYEYVIIEENNRSLIFPPHEFQEIPKINCKTTHVKTELKKLTQYGYNESIESLQKTINDVISGDLFTYYKDLFYPYPSNMIETSLLELYTKFSDVFDSSKSIRIISGPFNFPKIKSKIVPPTTAKADLTLIAADETNIIPTLIKLQNSNSIIIEVNDTTSQIMVEVIYILYQSYLNLYIYKPKSADFTTQTKYIIGINQQNKIDLTKFSSQQSYTISLFDEKSMNKGFLNLITIINRRLYNLQIKKLQEILDMYKFYDGKHPPADFINFLKKQKEINLNNI